MAKYKATLTSPDASDCSLDISDDIFIPNGDQEGGEPVYAKDGTGAPYLIYGTITLGSGEGLCLVLAADVEGDPMDLAGCYAESYPGTWTRSGGGSQPTIGETPEHYWETSSGLMSAGTSEGSPYIGQYGTPGSGALASWAPEQSYTGWFISNYATGADLQSAAGNASCNADQPFLYGASLPGTFAQPDPCGTGIDCAFSLAIYHYPNPTCIRVLATSSGGTPTYDYAGDYAFTDEYFPVDDIQDYGVFSDGTHWIWRCDDRWCMGDAVDGTPDYQSLVTDRRTPPRGPWLGVGSGTEGRYKTLPSCTGRLWHPWCACPCTPLFYDGCVEITCTTGECPEEALGVYYPYGMSEWGAWEFHNADGWILWVDNDKRTWMIGETQSAEDTFTRRAKTPIGAFQGQGAYAGMVVTGADVECPVSQGYCYCATAPVAYLLPLTGFNWGGNWLSGGTCDETGRQVDAINNLNGPKVLTEISSQLCWGAGATLQTCGSSEATECNFGWGAQFGFLPRDDKVIPTLQVRLGWGGSQTLPNDTACFRTWTYEGEPIEPNGDCRQDYEVSYVGVTEWDPSCTPGVVPVPMGGDVLPDVTFTPPGSFTVSPVQ